MTYPDSQGCGNGFLKSNETSWSTPALRKLERQRITQWIKSIPHRSPSPWRKATGIMAMRPTVSSLARKADLLRELTETWEQDVDPTWTVPELRSLLREIYEANPIEGGKSKMSGMSTKKLHELQNECTSRGIEYTKKDTRGPETCARRRLA